MSESKPKSPETEKPAVPANPSSLVQLHWYKIADPEQTEMVAQGGVFNSLEELCDWMEDVGARHSHECPDGWLPVFFNSAHPRFVWAANDPPNPEQQ